MFSSLLSIGFPHFYILIVAGYVDGTLTQAEASSTYQEEEVYFDEDTKHRLEIFPESPVKGFAIVKRVDDTLNLTCHVVRDSGPFLKFQLEWYLPQHINNR